MMVKVIKSVTFYDMQGGLARLCQHFASTLPGRFVNQALRLGDFASLPALLHVYMEAKYFENLVHDFLKILPHVRGFFLWQIGKTLKTLMGSIQTGWQSPGKALANWQSPVF